MRVVIRVLFVDDEVDLLAGLRRMLRTHRERWEMTFACSAAEALEMLAVQEVDVVVSDVLMPGMDGGAFLTELRERYPAVVRIVLSGQTQLSRISATVVSVHQFLAKPCEPSRLEAAVERSLLLRDRLTDAGLIELVGSVECLPSPSTTVLALRDELTKESMDLDRIDQLVRSDLAVSTKVLQLVNSAFFGLPRRMSHPSDALVYLGTRALCELSMSVAAYAAIAAATPANERVVARLQQTATARADFATTLAQRAGRDHHQCRDVWSGAFLADIGDLLLAGTAHGRDGADSQTVASVGAYLLSMWGLPHHLVETAALSREAPQDTSPDGPTFTWLARQALARS